MKKIKIIFNDVDDFTISKAADIVETYAFIGSSQKFVGEYVGYKFFVRIRTEDEEEVDFMYEMFGGARSVQEKDGKLYYWHDTQDRRAIMLLELVIDELERDKELAKLMIKLYQTISKGTRRRLTDEEKQERLDLYNQIKAKYRKNKPEINN